MLKKSVYASLFIFLLLLPRKTDSNSTKIIIYGVSVTVVVVVCAWKTIKKWWDIIFAIQEVEKEVQKVDQNVTDVKKDVEKVGENVEVVKKDVGVVKEGVENVQKSVEGVKTDVGNVQMGIEEAKVNIDNLKESNRKISDSNDVINKKVTGLQAEVSKFGEKTDKELKILLSKLENVEQKVKTLTTKEDFNDLKELLGAVDNNVDKTGNKLTSEIEKSKCEQKIFFKEKLDEADKNSEIRFFSLRQLVEQKIDFLDSKIREIGAEVCEFGSIVSKIKKIVSKEV